MKKEERGGGRAVFIGGRDAKGTQGNEREGGVELGLGVQSGFAVLLIAGFYGCIMHMGL
jgi:hypothetical protein